MTQNKGNAAANDVDHRAEIARLVLQTRTPQERTKTLTAIARAAMRGYLEDLQRSFSKSEAFLDELDAWADGHGEAPSVCRSTYVACFDLSDDTEGFERLPCASLVEDAKIGIAARIGGSLLGKHEGSLEDDDFARLIVTSMFSCLDESFLDEEASSEAAPKAMLEAARGAATENGCQSEAAE